LLRRELEVALLLVLGRDAGHLLMLQWVKVGREVGLIRRKEPHIRVLLVSLEHLLLLGLEHFDLLLKS
jgi:hypothetical protein